MMRRNKDRVFAGGTIERNARVERLARWPVDRKRTGGTYAVRIDACDCGETLRAVHAVDDAVEAQRAIDAAQDGNPSQRHVGHDVRNVRKTIGWSRHASDQLDADVLVEL